MSKTPARARTLIEYRKGVPVSPSGSIDWKEHQVAHAEYCKRYGTASQTALDIHERGGFGYRELTDLLGHEPWTWREES